MMSPLCSRLFLLGPYYKSALRGAMGICVRFALPRTLWYYRRGCKHVCSPFYTTDSAGAHMASAVSRVFPHLPGGWPRANDVNLSAFALRRITDVGTEVNMSLEGALKVHHKQMVQFQCVSKMHPSKGMKGGPSNPPDIPLQAGAVTHCTPHKGISNPI